MSRWWDRRRRGTLTFLTSFTHPPHSFTSHTSTSASRQPKSCFFYSNYVGNVNRALQHSAQLDWTQQHLQDYIWQPSALNLPPALQKTFRSKGPLGRRLQTPDPVLSTVRYSTKLMHQTTFCGSTIIHTVEGMTACTLSAWPVRGVEVRGLPCTWPIPRRLSFSKWWLGDFLLVRQPVFHSL